MLSSKVQSLRGYPISLSQVFSQGFSPGIFETPKPIFSGKHIPIVCAGELKEHDNGPTGLCFLEKASTEIADPAQSHSRSGRNCRRNWIVAWLWPAVLRVC